MWCGFAAGSAWRRPQFLHSQRASMVLLLVTENRERDKSVELIVRV